MLPAVELKEGPVLRVETVPVYVSKETQVPINRLMTDMQLIYSMFGKEDPELALIRIQAEGHQRYVENARRD